MEALFEALISCGCGAILQYCVILTIVVEMKNIDFRWSKRDDPLRIVHIKKKLVTFALEACYFVEHDELHFLFQGTNADQDNRFSDKEKKLLKQMKFEEILAKKVEILAKKVEILAKQMKFEEILAKKVSIVQR